MRLHVCAVATAIDVGVRGILNVMASLNMIAPLKATKAAVASTISHSSSWLRAPEGGILRSAIDIGARVAKDAVIGEISSPLGDLSVAVIAEDDGIVVGRTNLPIVNRGDALFHVARMKRTDMEQAPLDEDEII